MTCNPKCNYCNKTIRKNQKCICCSSCSYNFHVKCCKNNINASKSWTCEICSGWTPPFNHLSNIELATVVNPHISNLSFTAGHLNNIFADAIASSSCGSPASGATTSSIFTLLVVISTSSISAVNNQKSIRTSFFILVYCQLYINLMSEGSEQANSIMMMTH